MSLSKTNSKRVSPVDSPEATIKNGENSPSIFGKLKTVEEKMAEDAERKAKKRELLNKVADAKA